MPYDPRSVSEGGNAGIDEEFSRRAPAGKFRVIGVDTFDGGDWLEGDFDVIADAQTHIDNETRGKEMLKMHIYDDHGRHAGEAGSF